jgi:hypothetical protein
VGHLSSSPGLFLIAAAGWTRLGTVQEVQVGILSAQLGTTDATLPASPACRAPRLDMLDFGPGVTSRDAAELCAREGQVPGSGKIRIAHLRGWAGVLSCFPGLKLPANL